MKKSTAIFLIGLYAISSLGFIVKEYYCCGSLKAVTISLDENANYKNIGDDNKVGCCKTKAQYLKVKQSHLASTILINASHDFSCLPFCLSRNDNKVVKSAAEIGGNRSHAPPLHSGVAVYITNCVFRI